ncbi:hypothetical protein RAC89_10925 [Paenibacillus sp. GD4]|uniref:hypothetical protein n=1 Tax=Paenibacillus sp. GD4 TaxID=3068890 RepID=UPI0027966569|nr:hypothetical protein [Paenibacillus sp. GD4]MDQ1910973.1 hypothetical protein [Paenibacillus sp. GD4]
MNDRHLSKESTIYHYRLLQRIHHKPAVLYSYWALLLILLAWDIIQWNPWPFASAGLTVPVLHLTITYFSLRTMDGKSPKGWGWAFELPWFGYRPNGYISLEKLLKVHMQLLFITLVIVGCLFPWLSLNALGHLVFIHLWLIFPRFVILLKLHKHLHTGYVKINEADTSCYAQ